MNQHTKSERIVKGRLGVGGKVREKESRRESGNERESEKEREW